MANRRKPLKVALEVGLKEKRVVAVAVDWPGLERGAKTSDEAIERLQSYVGRYSRVAKLAGMDEEFGAAGKVSVVEEYEGVGSTDFWGISFAFSSIDQKKMSGADLERELTLMQACWTFLDDARGRVSAEMERGPRGGGRDRDQIVRHVYRAEQDWAKKLKIRGTYDPVVTDDEGVAEFHEAYCTAIRAFHAEGKAARTWPLRYLIRHIAYHAMDHAWEMEDKDLSGASRK